MSDSPQGPRGAEHFAISGGTRLFGYVCHEFPWLWSRLEKLESSLLHDRLEVIPVTAPVYVTGLARSGTTILLELLARLPSVATHRYRDFPPVWTPYLWNRFLELVPQRDVGARERPHQDGIEITPESPEALEEPLWMRCFRGSHDPSQCNLLGRETRNEEFAEVYRRHISKILLVRGGSRYVAKGNYNVARLAYIQTLFPDARFVVPIRHPFGHIASLSRQHRNFTAGQEANPAARDYLRRVGHFEFGIDRVPVNMGDNDAIRNVLEQWRSGDELGGWAAYWSHLYGRLRDQLDEDAALREAVLIVRYEELNDRPLDVLQSVLGHCGLDADPAKLSELAARLRPSKNDGREFSPAQARRIRAATESTMIRYGYPAGLPA